MAFAMMHDVWASIDISDKPKMFNESKGDIKMKRGFRQFGSIALISLFVIGLLAGCTTATSKEKKVFTIF